MTRQDMTLYCKVLQKDIAVMKLSQHLLVLPSMQSV